MQMSQVTGTRGSKTAAPAKPAATMQRAQSPAPRGNQAMLRSLARPQVTVAPYQAEQQQQDAQGATASAPTPTPSATQDTPQAAIGVAPQQASWSAVQSQAKLPGAAITGPPTSTTMNSIWNASVPHNAGITNWPVGYRAPDFDFNTTSNAKALPEAPEWYAKPTRKATAYEGSSTSLFTAPGRYKTGEFEGGHDVYWNFSAAVSAVIQTGEQEHCDDIAQAYQISLKEADDVLTSSIIGKNFGPGTSQPEAEQKVKAEITNKLTHKALGSEKSAWAGAYQTLYLKTRARDTALWHTIALSNRRAAPSGDVDYDVNKGSATIPGAASATIITY